MYREIKITDGISTKEYAGSSSVPELDELSYVQTFLKRNPGLTFFSLLSQINGTCWCLKNEAEKANGKRETLESLLAIFTLQALSLQVLAQGFQVKGEDIVKRLEKWKNTGDFV